MKAMEPVDETTSRERSPTTDPRWFATTHWSVVQQAADPGSPQAVEALEKLCRNYWLSLYSFVRRKGYSPHDAQDLTQGFFARLLRANSFAGVHRDKGKFRTFLLAALNHFLSDQRDLARAEKRGGGRPLVSLDADETEQLYLQLPAADLSPERAFDRRWAVTILEQALKRLRQDYLDSGKQALFDGLKGFLSAEADSGEYERMAPALGMSSGSIAVAVHRLRQRYRECIRLELANTVGGPADLDEEMNHLFASLGN